MEINNENNIKYLNAKKRVKQVKGFYIHALVFVLVNAFIIMMKVINGQHVAGEPQIKISQFLTIIIWGVGLVAHGLSVFLPNFILGKNWEEKKIRELMDKDKNQS
ncbi:2TM domain-containing protein [Cloacibacterium sp.]|jgi:uncharacterized membrane protein YhaH (DUF805 family)|uniref:2TM domain-containing protein n=1 Tax=Cloacibacterium sp. TaxID=1913682 RepID=UPI0035AF03AE